MISKGSYETGLMMLQNQLWHHRNNYVLFYYIL